ncbi:flavin reductase family protein [Paracoccus denitrificans]|jgi:flavin reductase (DIM6/NTAB) family NADH-FMN oxidoreductase RutF|uniref:Flavin reductase domain protein, FMN-binding protein n=2 Tax=Paracoccus denitrificans TaxID=266 RepID=A1AYJ5_PARDP|nr:flavin reductase family protein [Paracoccus denitrificans]ABL68339.1 flavin reductase domain protein, FMN-binding protein [Paracoccus denitrificans PD1222]MCU7428610.1 flavin reductase family protein [Paracoccus denitrificans]QAR26425.1 flavin reductase [Paracoccus denitrificans]SDI59887.1 NADH-FMN oxidoreductase RutF, flavin reductase (DIM6/NTAB) family [Paracoccus denitrificans]SFR06027.1 NADH-FMN oxidoreductase RutF, flavin reductase (DIM6/NTAB) family [Paracoccus denitrificans]
MPSFSFPCLDGDPEFRESLRTALRGTAVNVSILTARDRAGMNHGIAVTTAVPFSTYRPAMIVAVKHSASAYPAILDSNYFCLNQIAADEIDLLDRFSRSDRRTSRFATGCWSVGPFCLPYLGSALTSYFCDVQGAHDHEDQTVFIGRIVGVRLGNDGTGGRDPLMWINGRAARLAGREYV